MLGLGVDQEDTLGGLLDHHAIKLLAVAQSLLDSPGLGDVPPGPPHPYQRAILYEPSEIIQRVPHIAPAIDPTRLDVRRLVAVVDKGPQILYVLRNRVWKQLANPFSQQLVGTRKTVHAGQRVVALGEVRMAIKVLYLFVIRRIDRERPL